MSALTNDSIRIGFTAGLVVKFKAICRAYHNHQERRAGVQALSVMEDYLLKDLGIDRSEIVSVVYGSSGSRRRNHEAE
ncbi:DUF1127 domain-containing protein [Mesorhizobium xinjiangense]|uniref:DUF1127 domain-containing protein n=1 Tax=Mesorhizobium xinjiangense TaxID=2678685 RepID=UPI0012EEA12E|nr:DUF1127 domain-containing protein [Mesorhizobium xinjiangense]